VSTHENLTATHGATGAIVGTTNTQTLTNKTLTSPKINEDVVLTSTATELNYVDGVTSAIQTQIDNKASLSGATFTGAVSGTSLTLSGDLTVNGTTTTLNSTTLSVDDKNIELGSVATPSDATADGGGITLKGTTDKTFNWVDATDAWTSSEHVNLASGKSLYLNGTLLKDATETLTNKTLTSPVINTPTGITKSDVGLANVDNTTDAGKPISTATQTALDAKLASATASSTYAPLAGPTFTGTVVLPSTTSIGNVSSTELGYVDGVTSAIQTQLDTKETRYYTFVTDATTSRTIASSTDEGKTLKFTSSSAVSVTVPLASSDAGWAVGDYVELIQYGSGQITVAGAVGVTVNATDTQKKTRVQFSSMTLIKIDTNEWLLTGDTTA